jgi:hypothetical protein
MEIKVFNDGAEVFDGLLADFLADNDNDEWLTKECSKLESARQIEFREISGDWVIIRK